MKNRISLVAPLIAALFLGSAAHGRTPPAAQDPALFCYSTIDSLLAGGYDGEMRVSELRRHGDFALGAFDHLDGELIGLGGVFYQVRADGSVREAGGDDKVPLAYVVAFRPTSTVPVPAFDSLVELEAWLDRALPDKTVFQAIEVRGSFTDMQTRAVAAQTPPYRPLVEVLKTQVVFDRPAVRGSLVGMRSPAFSSGISVAGYHWHFISDDRRFGGHVLKTRIDGAVARVESLRRMEVQLPRPK